MNRLLLSLLLALLLFPPVAAQEDSPPLSGSALIDAELKKVWQENGIDPAPRAPDSEFLRRVTLDLTGTVPTLDDTVAFLKDRSSGKRDSFIDRLLASERYVRHWSETWAGILVGFSSDQRMMLLSRQVEKGLVDMIRENVPYDEFVRTVVTVSGKFDASRYASDKMDEMEEGAASDSGSNPLMLWYMQWLQNDMKAYDMAGKMSKTFLATQIQCAQCHDHPFDKWTQEDFTGMAAFFAQVQPNRRVLNREEVRDKKARPKYEFNLFDRRRGEVKVDGSKAPAKPTFLESGKGVSEGKSRRESFAALLTSRDNRQFARTYVNRMWFYFFGRGIVEPFDDFTARNKPSVPALLEGLTDDFIAHGYDMKHLIRTIVRSEAYQKTSAVKKRDAANEKYFPYARVRALTPEQLMNAIFDSCGLEKIQAGRKDRDLRRAVVRDRVQRAFRFTFGDDEGAETSNFEGTIPQSLLMMNSELLNAATHALPGSTLDSILKEYTSAEDRIEAIFAAFLCRPPTASEKSRYLRHVKQQQGNRGYEDVLWTLLNSGEFLFNH